MVGNNRHLLCDCGNMSLPVDQILVGDCQELSRAIPEDSIDIIITDPPYLREYLPLYSWLGEEAARVLKPGKFLFAYGGVEFLPQVMPMLLKPEELTYFWIFVFLHHGSQPRMWYKRLMSGYKFIAVLTKGNPTNLPWQRTVYSGRQDKRFHKWGQCIGFPMEMIHIHTKPGDIVYDPFCGGGTVPAAAKALGRHYIAFDTDEYAVATAMRRLDEIQIIPEPLQLPR